MFTLFRCFTDGCNSYEGKPLSEHLREAFGGVFIWGYVVVMILVTVGIFNMIMAIFIDNAINSAFRRRQKELSESAMETRSRIKRIVAQLAIDPSVYEDEFGIEEGISWTGLNNLTRKARARHAESEIHATEAQFEALKSAGLKISKKEFDRWLSIPQFVDLMEDSDIDTSNLTELFDTLDADMGGWLEPDEIVTGLLKLRGPVSKNDVIAIRLKVRYLTEAVERTA
eukprot:TRINITY_DN41537_c0_g1_i1.p1 TRINITY_DN41537_c0_g1~~TRINITY_DN41537_c0_g1_i1.p1  ORF type:complete len:239 (+),score=26.93 TRINITY_DN41537_c0_g1_i1:38-718(+)